MTQEVTIQDQTAATLTCTLASLADGNGRQSTLLTNSSNYPAAKVTVRVRTGSSPTADTVVDVYLLRYDGTVGDDECGTTDAALTVVNAKRLGSIHISAATSNADYVGVFDTYEHGPLGNQWGIAIVNRSGAALNGTEGNHDKRYWYYIPRIENDV